MNTTENNKLLAEFLGIKIIPETDEVFEHYIIEERTVLQLKFHNDWSWIMQVVEKIETAETKDGRTFTIDMHIDSVLIFEYGLTTNEIVFTDGKGRLENLYNACIEFVKWWNKEQMDSAEG